MDLVATHHEVRHAHVIVERDLAGGHASVRCTLIKLDVIKHFQGKVIVRCE